MLNDFNIIEDKSKIVIYGNGNVGRIIAEELKNKGLKIIFCDTNNKTETDENCNPSELLSVYKDFYVLIGSTKFATEIYNNLKKIGVSDTRIFSASTIYKNHFSNIFQSTDFDEISNYFSYDRAISEINAKTNDGWFLRQLDLIITEICTLKCVSCGSLMPYYKCPKNLDEETVIHSLENLLSTGCYISLLDMVGGEPFLNQKLMVKILDRFGKNPQIGCFVTISNGTIVPKRETVEALSRCNKAYVIFSNYGMLSTKQNEAIKTLQLGRVPCIVIKDEDVTARAGTMWVDYGEVKKYPYSREVFQRYFNDCMDAKSCTTMLNGCLYICPRTAHAMNANLLPRIPGNFVDFLSRDFDPTTTKNLCQILLHPTVYPEACEYCNRGAGIKVMRAKQL